jgi:CheY-like chemotaxis protein/HPt (histidine-containing phosphotransfer) domain-containing protein
MSHEIRTPLNGILGFASVLMDDAEPDSTQRDYLQTIRDSGRHLLTLINDILDLSKIESEQVEVERIRCSPRAIIEETVSILRVRAQERGLHLEHFWKGDAPETIESDPARLRQILMNLIGNAIKFTEVGSVQVAARLQHGAAPFLVIDVIDTGMGIAPESLERIFAPFVQADNSITRRFGGTGLGLSISHRLARLLGGDLTVISQPGRGSIFTLTVPTGPLEEVRLIQGLVSDSLPAPRTISPESSAPLPPCRILLVEDGVTNRKLFSLVLQRAGAEVHCAENGRLGVEAATREPFDLILMDMQMPVMDGYSAARALRQQGLTTPIIALTAHAMQGDMQKCLDAGCSGYLAKPIDPEKLLTAAAQMLAGAEPARPPSTVPDAVDRSATPLCSTLPLDDPDFREIVDEFVARLEDQLAALEAAWEREDRPAVAAIAHWIKGTAGTAGFPAFTQPSSILEKLAGQEGSADQIGRAIRELEKLFHRIQSPASL